MKGFLLIIITLIITSITVIAQPNINLDGTTNGTTQTVCDANFFDSGGQGTGYSNNESYTITLCPNATNSAVRILFPFTSLNLGSGDMITIYDGNNTSAPILAMADNTANQSIFVEGSVGGGGCITVEFISDGAGIGSGWEAVTSCVPICQTIIPVLTLTTPAIKPSTGTIDICPGETVDFIAQGNYPQNNIAYAQSDATSTFEWVIEGQNYTGQTVQHTFLNPGGFIAKLTITDANNCSNLNPLEQEIRVSNYPIFDDMNVPTGPNCVGDTLTFLGTVQQTSANFAAPVTTGDSIFLPDGNGVTYSTSVNITDFAPGQFISSINDLEAICINFEHSFMGDLDIEIECPNGQIVQLHNQAGSGTFLGIPVDNDATPLIPGQGFDYCWEMAAPNPTWAAASAGVGTLPAGSYTPEQSFNLLNGCPLNGTWTLRFEDNIGSDNGFLFGWSLDFADVLYPNLAPFTPVTDSVTWVNNSSIITEINDSTILCAPTLVGTYNYIFSTYNDFGCQFDTTVILEISPLTNPTCLNCDSIYVVQSMSDTTICLNDAVDLDATVISNITESKFTYTSGEPIITNNQIEAELTVSGIVPGTVTASSIVDVCIDISHQFPADLEIFLIAPNGQIMELTTNNGGFSPNPNTYENTCFSTTAAQAISAATPPFNGTYLPEGSFNFLNTSAINGTWKLQVLDGATAAIDGVLNNWSITFNQTHNINYFWTPTTGLSCSNCPNPTATPTTTTEYIVNINDNFGCAKADTLTVNVIQPLAAPAPTCGNLTGTSIEINWAAITGATAYEVNINNTGWVAANGTLSHQVTGLIPNQTVNFQVRALQGLSCDANNGIGTVSCTTLPCNQSITLDSTQAVSCFNGNDGIAYFTTTGSFGGSTYTLNGNSNTTGTFSNLAANTYRVFVSDVNNCLDSLDFVITQPDTMTFVPTIINNTCFNESNGSINLSVTGGTAPYNYAWQGSSETSSTLSNLAAGNYNVTVTDANNCQKIATYSITQPADISLTTSKTNVLCFGGNDGTATVLPTGGTGTYNYSWNTTPNQTTPTATGLPIGTYQVIVEDINNCLDSTTVTINQPTLLVASMDSTDASCFGFNDGTATVSVIGGTGNRTYNWSTTPAQDSTTAINLIAGTYFVTATDANNCQIIDTVIINQPTEIQLSFTTNQVTCFGLSDGDATVTAIGGVGSIYTYAWNTIPTQNLPTALNLPGGLFNVTVTDSTNCSVSDTVSVYAPVILDLDILTSTPTSCFAGSDGSVTVQTSGGTGSKTYAWDTNPISNGATQTGLITGQYTVTATDQQGCQLIDSIIVQQPDSIQAMFMTDSVSCFGGNDGTAIVSVIGGTTNYTFAWANGQTTAQATGLPTGFAVVTITDANNCVLIDSVFVPEPTPISATFTTTQVSCNGDGDGTATVIASGGTPIYSYLWSNAQTTQTATGLSGGFALVTVTDWNGCTFVDSVSVLEQPALITTDTSFQISCFGANDGTAIALPAGGTGIYNYQWQGLPQTNDTISNLAGGMYYYTVTDSDNCTISDSVFVVEPTPLTVSLSSKAVTCFGDIDGQAYAVPSGGTAPYFYNWNNSLQNTDTVFSLSPGFITITVTDVYNCQIIDSVLVDEPTPVNATNITTPTFCNGSADGTAMVLPSGGVGNYTYNWLADGQDSVVAIGLAAGTYFVEVSDSNNCTYVDTAIIIEPTPLGITSNTQNVSCFGQADGAISVTTVGGVGGYTYAWNTTGGNTTSSVTGLIAGTYTVTITDANNCVLIDSFVVTQPVPVTFTSGSTPVSCFSGSDGSAFINVAGGTMPYSYNWNPTNSNSDSIVNLTAGNYEITVTDALGCIISDTILVNEPTAVSLSLSQQPSSCNGIADGEAYVAISGGIPNYSILWNNTPNGVTDSIAYLLGNRNYIVTVTDSNGCVAIDSVFVVEPDIISATITITDETCFDAEDGTATAVITGGTAPFTYDWGMNANNQTTQTATNLSSGVYNVLVSDINNCNTDAIGVINQPDSLKLRLTQQNIDCFGDETGSASAIAIGGTAGYSFAWQTNTGTQNGKLATDLNVGIHTVAVTDTNGCMTIDTVTITEPDAPISAIINTENVDCFGDEDGSIEVITSGGTAPYEYTLDAVDYTTSNILIGLDAANYTIIIRDANDCILEETAIITEPDEIEVDLGSEILVEYGETVDLDAQVTNGIEPFVYVWQPLDSTLSCLDCPNPTVSNIPFYIRYDLIVTDATGCTAEDFVIIRTEKTRNVFVANAFTPNGDGVNDALFVQGDLQVGTVNMFRIYDRWGELVFESMDNLPNESELGWDGTFKGQDSNPGVYVWYAEVEFADGEVKVYQGDAVLIR